MWKIVLATIVIFLVIASYLIFSNYNVDNKSDTETTTDPMTLAADGIIPGKVEKVDESTNIFTHPQYNFSLKYPSKMTVSNFREGDGEEILFQDKEDKWFQIYILPWDEGDNLTVERIKKDLPNIVISSPQRVVLGPSQKDGVGPDALIFFSKDSSLGDTREIWFVYNGDLYQVTTYKKLDSFVGQILSTLVFN